MATTDTPASEWREIACGSQSAARAEAQRQQVDEDSDDVEWIYLRNRAGVWVARRTPRHLDQLPPEKPRRAWRLLGLLFDSVLDTFPNW